MRTCRVEDQAETDGGESYQRYGLDGNLPVFYEQLKSKLNFPFSWTSGRFSNFSAWKRAARAKVLEKIIEQPDHTPFNPRVIGEVDRGSYMGRQLVFNLTAESRVAALELVPKGKGPFPAVLLLHDHGARFDIGKEKMIEPWEDETRLQAAKMWSDKYFSGRFVGDQLAARGYLVLAIDAFGWGDRGVMTYEAQQAVACNLMNLGSSLAGLMAGEDMRAASFLASLPEVDKSRVAALGFSMGGYRAWQVAALSDFIQAAVAVCWMGTVKGLMVPGNNQLRGQSAFCLLHPGLINYLDYPDVASIAAPKPMLFFNGGKDQLFPVESVDTAFQKMRTVWNAQCAGDKLETKIWPELGHVFVQEQQDEAFKWLDKVMKE